MIDIVCATIAAISAVAVAYVGKKVKQINDKNEERTKLRRRESLLSLKIMDAVMQLSVVCSNALTNGHNNGNVEKAREAAEQAKEEYDQFMMEVTAHQIGK